MESVAPNLPSLFTSVALPIMVLIGIGILLDRRFKVDLRSLVKLNLYLLVPCFLFVRLLTSPVALQQGLKFAGFTLLMILTLGGVSWIVARLMGLKQQERKALQLASMFYNCGNYGIPLTSLAFPPLGPVVQSFVLMTMNIATFTLGIGLSRNHPSDTALSPWQQWAPVLRQPSLYGIALALTLRATGGADLLPSIPWIWMPLEQLANALVAMALLTLGVQMSQTANASFHGKLAAAVSLRLVFSPLLAFFLVKVFGIPWETGRILILGAAAPTAVNTALLAHEFEADSEMAAAAVFYSTAFSAVTVTIVLFLLSHSMMP